MAFFIIFSAFCVEALTIDKQNLDYAKNYIIILVHGIGDDHKCFNNVKTYLESQGLTGYVYAYQFSDQFLNIEKEGWEFGSRSYDNPEAVGKKSNEIDYSDDSSNNKRKPWQITKRQDNGQGGTGKSWLEQAKEDFAINNPGKTAPSKFIVIAHSMGGLAVRSYIFGKDQNGNRCYQGDIEKVVYIDTPHLGSTTGKASIWAQDEAAYRYSLPVAMLAFGIFNPYITKSNPELGKFLVTNATYSLSGSVLFDGARKALNRLKSPALEDMSPNSPFLNYLNGASLGNYNPVNQRIIIGRGTPTAKDAPGIESYFHNLIMLERISSSLLNAVTESDLETWEEKMISINLSCISGIPFFEDGDLVVTTRSQKGEGISNLNDAKKYEYLFRSSSIAVFDTAATSAYAASYFMPSPADYFYMVFSLVYLGATLGTQEDAWDLINAHITMKDRIVLDKGLLDKALFEEIQPAGESRATSVQQVPFKMTSNITIEGGEKKILPTHHEVSIESMTENTAPASIGIPIIINGKEKNISTFTVKEPPTRIEGVLRDFMPKYMQYFQYSENFSAWKDIKILDEWGRFQIDNLKLAEGQNVIAFRAKNKVGYTSNQILNITVNTIPMLATNIRPLSGTYTNNNRPKFSGIFSKTSYSDATLEAIDLDYAKLICGTVESDVTRDVAFKTTGGLYDQRGSYEYVPKEPLADGKYSFVIGVKSNVGSARAISDVVIDTVAPGIRINGMK